MDGTMDSSLKQAAKTYYEAHRVSFQTLADISLNVLGQDVTIDQLKKWSQEDAGWKKLQLASNEKTAYIAELLFEKIEQEADELSAKDLTALANSYLSFATKAPDDSNVRNKPPLQDIMDAVHALDTRTNTTGS